MSYGDSRRHALTLLETCLGVGGAETLLVVCDAPHRGVLKPFRDAARAIGLRRLDEHLYVDGDTLRGVLPSYEVVIFCVSDALTLSLGHSDARLQACRSGSRVAFLTQPLESTPPPGEIFKVAKATNTLRDRLRGARKLAINTSSSELVVDVSGRDPLALTSLVTRPGAWGAVPDYAEVALAPIESSPNGSFVIDACVVGLGALKERLTLFFENGRLKLEGSNLVGESLSRMMAREPGLNVLSEVGFGTNRMRREFRREFDDKKALGSAHLGLGDNHTIGGVNRSSLHLDCLAKMCGLRVDGVPIDFQSLH